MNFNDTGYLCPRLVDYLVIVGTRDFDCDSTGPDTESVDTGSESNDSLRVVDPKLLRRYPAVDHPDFALSPDVVYFAQPEGCYCTRHSRLNSLERDTITSSSGSSLGTVPENRTGRDQGSFVFTLTDKDSGRTRFGICVNFYLHRKISSGHSHDNLPSSKSSGYNKSRSRRYKDKKNIPRQLNIDEENGIETKAEAEDRTHHGMIHSSLTSLCLLSHHPFFSTFRDCLTCLRKIIDSCQAYCDKYCRANKSNNKFHSDLSDQSLWDIIMDQSSKSLINPAILEVAMIVESWILRLLSAPVPIPGRTRVELEILPKHFYPRGLLFALPDSTRFSLVDFPLHLPLELLGIDTCLQVLTCIMLEQKIIMQSRDHNALTMSVMALVSMIYPLEYMFPVIPLLPITLRDSEQLLLAPTPFIIGVPSSFFSAKRNVTIPKDVWLVDLDANKVIGPKGFDLPPFPEPEGTVLRNHLMQALYSMSVLPPQTTPTFGDPRSKSNSLSGLTRSHQINNLTDHVQETRLGDLELENLNLGNDSVLKYGNDVDSVDMATRIAMVKFFDSTNMFANFEEHCHILRLYPRPVVAFQINSFMRSRPRPTRFLFELAKTQAFEYFSEWSLSPSNAAYQRVKIGITDPAIIGDKAKWFSDSLIPIKFSVLSTDENHYSSTEEFIIQDGEVVEKTHLSTRRYSSPTLGHILHKVLFPTGFHKESSAINLLRLPANPPLGDSRSENGGSESDSSNTSSSYSYSNESISSTINTSSERGRVPPSSVVTRSPQAHSSYTLSNEDQIYKAPTQLRMPSEDELKIAARGSSARENDMGRKGRDQINKLGLKGDNRFLQVGGRGLKETSSGDSSSIPTDYSTENDDAHSDRDEVSSQLSQITTVSAVGKEFYYYYNHNCQERGDGVKSESLTDEGQSSLTNNSSDIHLSRDSTPIMALNDDRASPISNQALGLRNSKHPLPFLTSREVTPARAIVGVVDQCGFEDDLEDVGDRLIRHFSSTMNNFHLPRRLFDYYSKTFWFKTQEEVPLEDILPYGANLQYGSGNGRMSKLKAQNIYGSNVGKGERFYSNSLRERKSTVRNTITRGGNAGIGNRPRLLSTGEESAKSSSSILLGSGNDPRRSSTSFWARANMDKTNQPNEIQQYLNEILDSVTKGQGVGWLKVSKFRTLLQDESSRLYMVNRLNRNARVGNGVRMDASTTNDITKDCTELTLTIPHVALSRPVWKGFASVLKCCLSGFEHTYSNYGIGGMASAYQMLEIMNTHYYCLTSQMTSHSPHDETVKSIRRRSSNLAPGYSDSHKKTVLLNHTSSLDNEGTENHIIENFKTTCSTFMDPGKTYEKLSSIGSKFTSTISNAANSALDMADDSRKRISTIPMSQNARLSTDSIEPNPNPILKDQEYLYETLIGLLLGKDRSRLWDQSQFWEDIFMDAVTQERDMIGLDLGPSEMMLRYASLADVDKKRMELEEDNLLAIQLLNLVAFMVMMKVNKRDICHKVRRLLAKSHVGLKYSQAVNKLLDKINNLEGNEIPLLVPASRQIRKMSFTVRSGIDPSADSMIMEVCEDAIVFRTSKGEIIDRLWYDKLINMTLSPRSKVLCLWWKCGAKTYLQKFYTRKCRELYESIKHIMERVADKKGSIKDSQIGGHFQIGSLYSDQLGDLDVSINGISIAFPEAQTTLHLNQVKKCKAEKDNKMFTLEIFGNPITLFHLFNLELANPNIFDWLDYYTQQLVELIYTANEAMGIPTSASVICYVITTCFHYHLWKVLSRNVTREQFHQWKPKKEIVTTKTKSNCVEPNNGESKVMARSVKPNVGKRRIKTKKKLAPKHESLPTMHQD